MKDKYYPHLKRASDALKTKLINDLIINPKSTESVQDFLLDELTEEANIVRARVSGYSKETKSKLLNRARKTIDKK